MKKLLITLTVLFSSLFFIDNVRAEDTVTFPENMFDYIHMINTKDMSNDEVISMMTEKGFSEDYINGYLNFKNHINTYQQEDKYYFFAPGSGSSLYSSRLYINLTSNGLLAYFGIHYYDNYVYPLLNVRVSDSNKIYYTITSTSDYTIKTGSSAQWVTKVRATNEYLYENDLKEVYYFYETNMEIPISYSSDTGNYTGDLIINNETYALNSTLPYNTLDGVNSKKNYAYNEEIDTSNLAYIRVDFDTNGTTYDDYHFSILENVSEKLKEVYFEKSHEWGVCVDADHCYDNYVNREYAEYTNDFNMYSYSAPFKYEDVDHGFYDETQELNYYYAYYDVSNISDIVILNIDSTVTFTVSYGYLENYTDTFVTLNLKNYSGIILYPKANIYNGDYRFYLDNANINVIHYHNGNIVNIYENISSNIYYINQLEYQDLKRFYLIENNKIKEDSYITFNTNYFSYQLVEKTTDSITIVNPNTGKEEIINSIDTSKYINKINSVDDVVNLLNSNKGILSKVFAPITTIWNNLITNGELYIYLLIIIGGSILIYIIKSMK